MQYVTKLMEDIWEMFPTRYWGFSFKSTRGVTRDPFFKFDISTPAKIWHDTLQNFDKSQSTLCLPG
jgi:hypothetical protein